MSARTVASGAEWQARSAPVLTFLQSHERGVTWPEINAWAEQFRIAGETLGHCLAWLELQKQAHTAGDPLRWRPGPRPGAEPTAPLPELPAVRSTPPLIRRPAPPPSPPLPAAASSAPVPAAVPPVPAPAPPAPSVASPPRPTPKPAPKPPAVTQAERQAWLATKPKCAECQGPITEVSRTCDLPVCWCCSKQIGEEQDLCLIHFAEFVGKARVERINPWPPKRSG